MKNGIQLKKKTPKHHYSRDFGGTMSVPDFCLDKGYWMPDQTSDMAPTVCTGYSTVDRCADIDGVLYSPDRQYAFGLLLAGIEPTTAGGDPLSALESPIVFGLQKAAGATISSKTHGELFCANYRNWSDRGTDFKSGFVYNALGFTDPFTSVLSASWTQQDCVCLASGWWPEWEQIGSDGILPMPDLTNQNVPGHMYNMKGKKTINGKEYWMLKSWQGTSYGDNGWCYMSREVANAVFSQPNVRALILPETGNAFISKVQVSLQHIPAIPAIWSY